MKKKTPNAQRRTLNIEWSARGVRLYEMPTAEYEIMFIMYVELLYMT